MSAAKFFRRFHWRRTPQEIAAIVADMVLAEPPTHQEIIDQLDIDAVRQFLRMLDVDVDAE